MKTTVILSFFVIISTLIWSKKSQNIVEKTPIKFIQLESKNGSNRYLSKLPLNWLTDLEKKYLNQEFKSYPNEYTEQSEKLCNNVYSYSKYWEKGKTHTDFLNELTKEQRIYFTLINFEAQVNNGGVHQFLFNYPELSIIALESMRIAKMGKLASDYEKVLKEYFGKFSTTQELYSKFQNENSDWDERWNSFTEGYKELKTTETIENYFYKEEFVKDFQEKTIAFVKENKAGLLIEE